MKNTACGITSDLLVRAARLIVVLALCSPSWASDDAIACVAELTMPSSYSTVFAHIPATIGVHISIGEGGKAQVITYDTHIQALKTHLDAYFKDKARYLDVCRGKTISFNVHYLVVEPPVDFPISEVRFQPPDQFFVICHALKPNIDPVRPNQLRPK